MIALSISYMYGKLHVYERARQLVDFLFHNIVSQDFII